MRKTIEENNKEILATYFSGIDRSLNLTLEEASELNAYYLATRDEETYKKLLVGTQHFIYDAIKICDIQLGDQTIVDMNDVISFFNMYFIDGIEKGLFVGAKLLVKNGLSKTETIKSMGDLENVCTKEFIIDLLTYTMTKKKNSTPLLGAKEIITNDFLRDLYAYIGTGKNFDIPLQQAKDIEGEDSFTRLEERIFINDLLDYLEENDMLITKDIYEEYFMGDKAVKTGKRRESDFFLTNRMSHGNLFRVLRSHPMFETFRDEVKSM